MESVSAEATNTDAPSKAEISARLERATRSALASSRLSSYSYSDASSRVQLLSELPSLEDLLTHVGPPDCLRCPSCRAPLPLGSYSRLCLACDATFVEIPPPTLNSSIAFRRFSESLELETDFGVSEEERFPDQGGSDILIKPSLSSSLASGDPGLQKGRLNGSSSSDQKNSSQEGIAEKSLSNSTISGDVSSVAQTAYELTTQKQFNILDYSSKLEGISLEDFFSNQSRQEASTPPKTDIVFANPSGALTNANTPVIKVQKESLFWDPLSETIIPDGFDMMASTSELISSEIMTGFEEDDDPFSSWEGDFQSAPPAMTNISAFHTFEPPSLIEGGDLEGFFTEFETTKQKDNVKSEGLQEGNGLANGAHLFGSSADITVASHSDANDLFFGSEQEQNRQPSTAALAANGWQPTGLFNEEDVFGAFSFPSKEIPPTSKSSLNLGNSTVRKIEPEESQPDGSTNKTLESFLAQLHDLSFMLADKLVINSKGDSTKPNLLS